MGQTLRRRRIGPTQLQVSELGLGAASLGNLYRPISDEDARRNSCICDDGRDHLCGYRALLWILD